MIHRRTEGNRLLTDYCYMPYFPVSPFPRFPHVAKKILADRLSWMRAKRGVWPGRQGKGRS